MHLIMFLEKPLQKPISFGFIQKNNITAPFLSHLNFLKLVYHIVVVIKCFLNISVVTWPNISGDWFLLQNISHYSSLTILHDSCPEVFISELLQIISILIFTKVFLRIFVSVYLAQTKIFFQEFTHVSVQLHQTIVTQRIICQVYAKTCSKNL